jgi:hypothetical protein
MGAGGGGRFILSETAHNCNAPDRECDPAVQAGREHLAGQFGLDPYNVVVESIEAEEWSDTCMGADLPSQVCEATPTRGYAMELRLGGQVFPYRANEAGTRAVPLFPIGY